MSNEINLVNLFKAQQDAKVQPTPTPPARLKEDASIMEPCGPVKNEDSCKDVCPMLNDCDMLQKTEEDNFILEILNNTMKEKVKEYESKQPEKPALRQDIPTPIPTPTPTPTLPSDYPDKTEEGNRPCTLEELEEHVIDHPTTALDYPDKTEELVKTVDKADPPIPARTPAPRPDTPEAESAILECPPYPNLDENR